MMGRRFFYMQTQLVNLDATTNSQSKIQNSSKGSQTKTVSSFEKHLTDAQNIQQEKSSSVAGHTEKNGNPSENQITYSEKNSELGEPSQQTQLVFSAKTAEKNLFKECLLKNQNEKISQSGNTVPQETGMVPTDTEKSEVDLDIGLIEDDALLSVVLERAKSEEAETNMVSLPELEEAGDTVQIDNKSASKNKKKVEGIENIPAASVSSCNIQQISSDPALIVSDTMPFNTELSDHRLYSQGRSEKPLISVIDERSQISAQEAVLQNGNIKTDFTGNGVAQMSLTLSEKGAVPGTAAAKSEVASSRFASMLSAEINAHAGEFVKTGSIILRDNNVGSINLVLHPEELGDVKISLKLTDKIIAGHITVASQEAYNAFKSNIETLRQAFISNGFEAAGFELSWSGSDTDQGDRQQQGRNLYHGLAYVESIPDAVGTGVAEKKYSDSSQYAVNVMV